MNKEEVLSKIKSSKEKGMGLKELKNTFEEENIEDVIKELELEGKIFELKNKRYVEFPSEYSIGTITCDHKGNRFVTSRNGRIYVNHEDLNGALDFDTVVYRADLLSKRAVIKKILDRKNNKVVCEVHTKGNKKTLRTYNAPGIIDIIISDEELSNYVDGDRLIVEISKDTFLNPAKGKVIKHLGHKNSPNIDEISIISDRGFNTEFDEEYMKELEALPKEVTEDDIKGRLDLRDKEVFTIDGKDTMDIDDAISLEKLDNGNYLLGVHIAHVSHYVKPGTKIFKEAYQRGTSVYAGNSVNPMFHPLISNGICSLNPGVDRLARSTFTEFNSRGKIVDYKLCNTVIHSKKKMTYEEFNEILENGNIPDGYELFVNTLMMLSGLTETLIEKRKNLGGVEFCSNEIKVLNDENNETVGFKKREQNFSHKTIENSMIAANETVAQHSYYQSLPFIYRVHDRPDENKIENAITLLKDLGYRLNFLKDIDKPFLLQSILKELSTKEEFSVLSNLFLKSMKRAEYSNYNSGHYALASDHYTHFTAPIRRLADFINQTLLDLYENDITNVDFKYIDDALVDVCEHASYTERQADLAEEEVNRLRMAQYMSNHIGEIFYGRIVEIYPDEINIITDDNIYGSVPISFIEKNDLRFHPHNKSMTGAKNVYLLGNKVEVKVSGVSLELKKVFFDLGDNLSLKNSSRIKKFKK